MNKTESLYERRKKSVPNALGIICSSSIQSAKGAIIIDADGRELIDFAGGIGVNNAGHGVNEIITAIQQQAEKFIHASFNVSIYEAYLDLTEKLCSLLPHGNATKTMLTLSGAESVENAIKIAKAVTGKPGIICYSGAFHGRSMMALTLTSNTRYKEGVGPYAPEVYRLEFPYYGPKEKKLFKNEEDFAAFHINKLNIFFSTYVSASQIAAVIMELVQGEGGFTVASKIYVTELRKICTEKNILLILDEVQTGFGRTGKWAAFEHYYITPDLSTWAKSMGGGMPIGAVIGRQEIMDAVKPGLIGGTYLGNALCCVASLASINYMQKNNINAAAEIVGKIVLEKFMQLQKLYPNNISDVRGLGAMLAIEFVKPNTNEADSETAKAIVNKCFVNGLITITSGTSGNCIRILSPLFIENEILQKGLSILEKSIQEIIQ